LRLIPVLGYPRPRYPTRDAVRDEPDMVRRTPSRWVGRGAASVVTLALGAVPACAGRSSSPAATATEQVPRAEAEAGPAAEAAPVPSPTATAPEAAAVGDAEVGAQSAAPPSSPGAAVVFEGGEGRGSVGCVAIAPPVFLTEQEALQTIGDELSRAGLTLGPGGATVPDVRLPLYEQCGPQTGLAAPASFELDASVQGRAIALEVLTSSDLDAMWDPSSGCSVQSYRFLEAAREIARQMGRPQNLLVGVFYDPATRYCRGSFRPQGLTCESSEAAARGKSQDDLRAQVRQFIGFLRSSGAI